MCARVKYFDQRSRLVEASTRQVAEKVTGAPFAGFVRKESMAYWKARIVSGFKVPVAGFAERVRDPSGNPTNDMAWEETPERAMWVLIVKSPQGGLESRIITGPASLEMAEAANHDRAPVLVSL